MMDIGEEESEKRKTSHDKIEREDRKYKGNWLRQNCFAPGNGCPFLFFSYYRLSKCYFFLNMVCLNMGSLFSRLVGFMKYGKGGGDKNIHMCRFEKALQNTLLMSCGHQIFFLGHFSF
jgi:hypothetical protein